MNKRLYVDFHILQTVPPSCINRDDTGSPKTAVYGGVLRARVSSQRNRPCVRDGRAGSCWTPTRWSRARLRSGMCR